MVSDADTPCGTMAQENFADYPGNDYVNHRMYADALCYLPDQLLHLTDRMSMAPSLEARAPFLDYRLVEFATSLPGDWKVRGSQWKLLLKESMGNLVPQEIIKRPKWGFASPAENWMTGKHLEAFHHLCADSRLVDAGVVDGDAMRDFLANPQTTSTNSHWLWAVCILEIWFRIFCEGDPTRPPQENLVEFAR